jgi:hypothetical protein
MNSSGSFPLIHSNNPVLPWPGVLTAIKHPNSKVRWEKTRFNVVLETLYEPFLSLEISTLLDQALQQWTSASRGKILFVLNPSSNPSDAKSSDADIRIIGSTAVTLGRDYEVGHTDRIIKNNQIHKATITLIADPVIDKTLNHSQRQHRLLATLLHEVGHAIGLEHSTNPQDNMFYRGWTRTQLGIGDIRQIQLYYP